MAELNPFKGRVDSIKNTIETRPKYRVRIAPVRNGKALIQKKHIYLGQDIDLDKLKVTDREFKKSNSLEFLPLMCCRMGTPLQYPHYFNGCVYDSTNFLYTFNDPVGGRFVAIKGFDMVYNLYPVDGVSYVRCDGYPELYRMTGVYADYTPAFYEEATQIFANNIQDIILRYVVGAFTYSECLQLAFLKDLVVNSIIPARSYVSSPLLSGSDGNFRVEFAIFLR